MSAAGILIALLGIAWCVPPAQAKTEVFDYTGYTQNFYVPTGVSIIHIEAVGGSGGTGPGGRAGGTGAAASAYVSVTPERTLYVRVGGNGDDGATATTAGEYLGGRGGFNGGGAGGNGCLPTAAGGGGGGASDVRTKPEPDEGSLDSRLVVAAGGGGGPSVTISYDTANATKARIGRVKVSGPAKAVKGKASSYKVTVTNSGGAVATGVKVRVKGKGLKAAVKVGKIAAGKSRKIKVKLKPKRAGMVKATFRVTSDNAGARSASKRIAVNAH